MKFRTYVKYLNIQQYILKIFLYLWHSLNRMYQISEVPIYPFLMLLIPSPRSNHYPELSIDSNSTFLWDMNTENTPIRTRTALLSLHAERHGCKADLQPMGTRGKACGWLPGSVLRRWLAFAFPLPSLACGRAEGTAGAAAVTLGHELHDRQAWALPGSPRTTEPVRPPRLPMFT